MQARSQTAAPECRRSHAPSEPASSSQLALNWKTGKTLQLELESDHWRNSQECVANETSGHSLCLSASLSENPFTLSHGRKAHTLTHTNIPWLFSSLSLSRNIHITESIIRL